MIKLSLDKGAQEVFLNDINHFIEVNPILIQHIIEPVINKVISDQNIPNKISELLQKTIYDIVNEEIRRTDIEEVIKDSIGSLNDRVDESIDREIEMHISKGLIKDYMEDSVRDNIISIIKEMMERGDFNNITQTCEDVNNIIFDPEMELEKGIVDEVPACGMAKYDTITLKVNSIATQTFTWMVKTLFNKDIIILDGDHIT